MQRKHMALVALGLGALAGLVGLWRLSQGGTSDAQDGPGPGVATAAGGRDPGTPVENATARGPAATSAVPATRPEVPLPGLGFVDQPELQAGSQTAPGSAARDDGGTRRTPRVYVRDDGAVVRDYRTGDAPPMLSATGRRPPRGPVKLEPTTVIAVRTAIRPIVFRCSGEIPDTSLGAKPRLEGEVVISIADGNVSVDDVAVQVADVQEPAASQLRECVAQGAKPVTLTIPGAANVTGHTLRLPFRLRQ